MKVLFDLDPAVYMASFAAQQTLYSIVYEDAEGELHEQWFQDGNKKNAWKKENTDKTVLEETKDLVVESESHARQCAKTILDRARREIEKKFKTKDLDIVYFLTGKGNFREELATVAKYKGNRDQMEKPVHYQAVRDYLVASWGAYVIDGIEADDEVSIRAWDEYRGNSNDYVVATIDKDLDQIPGWHYDYKKHVFYEVDELDGELFFYAQIISGDATDNIKGCYRIGISKAVKLVDEWFDLATRSDIDFREYIWEQIIETYKENQEKFPDKHPEGLSAEDEALENARLVYMQQKRDELWQP